jgi:hypothetical protein
MKGSWRIEGEHGGRSLLNNQTMKCQSQSNVNCDGLWGWFQALRDSVGSTEMLKCGVLTIGDAVSGEDGVE